MFFSLTGVLLVFTLQAQTTFPIQGIPDPRSGWYVFRQATIQLDTATRVEGGTMIIRDGRIVDIGIDLPLPPGAVVVDLKGKYVYPSFIDLASDYGIRQEEEKTAASESAPRRGRPSAQEDRREGPYGWNEALRADFRAVEVFQPDEKKAASLRLAGFGTVLTHRMDGISRGSGALVTLGGQAAGKEVIRQDMAHVLSFKKGTSRTDYPGSLMGCIALLRQTYLDGQWYARQREETDLSLEAWNRLLVLPQIFEVRDWQEVLRARAIAREFGQTYLFLGAGDEYQRLDALRETGASFILPLDFPEPFQIEGPFDAWYADLEDMKHWEWAPANPAAVARAGIPFALTAHGLPKTEQFLPALRKALRYGLTEMEALAALTQTPARLLRMEEEVGTLGKGKRANFLITSGPLFAAETVIHENWVNGKPHVVEAPGEPDLDGKYRLVAGGVAWSMEVRGGLPKNDMELVLNDTTRVTVRHQWEGGTIHLRFTLPGDTSGHMLSGRTDSLPWTGRGTDPEGFWIDWTADYIDTVNARPERTRDKEAVALSSLSPVTYPFLPYGRTAMPARETWLIRNATLWTNESEGILEGTDILLQDGKIARMGKDLVAPPGAREMDAGGRHVTPGIIDEHSHIAISRGVNECTQENTAEVRIGDVINSQDINIYRQLSGGVTAAQLLHGSCNPLGGQSAIIKLRWGATPEEMKVEGADGFIKFALGENVKRGNASSNNRYPNTRMGVEQVYVNAFTRAREYEARKKDLARKNKTRPDLELEATAEILAGRRFVTCHSYVQSEINMLMHVAEDFGFKVNTFTHILEGYKVADKMAKHGAGGSSFSDWWAYKFEVYDAIPYNGAILHEQGVVTAFNSDDPEMARRLNQEAAKAVLYGGVSEEDALKFVTLHPARLLHLDHRMGSLKVGKDADIVIWSAHPLSMYAKAESTFVDGRRLFDRGEDLQMRDRIREERQRLMAGMRSEGKGRGRPVQPKEEHHYHCDTVTEEILD